MRPGDASYGSSLPFSMQPQSLQQMQLPLLPPPPPMPSVQVMPAASTAVTAASAGLIDRAAKVIDLRARPPQFSGDEKQWEEWRFKMETLLNLLNMKETLAQAVTLPMEELQRRLLEPEIQAQSSFLYNVLVEACKGKASAMIRLERDGLTAWRKLVEEFEPQRTFQQVAQLSKLLTPTWRADQPFLPQLQVWEQHISEYEVRSKTSIASNIKCAVVAQWSPEHVRNLLRYYPQDLSLDYGQLREVLVQQHLRARMYSGSTGRVLQLDEVDGAFKGKAKGKGKEEGQWQTSTTPQPQGKRKRRKRVAAGETATTTTASSTSTRKRER